MKTLLTAATLAVLAFVLLEISQSDARPGHGHGPRRCPERERPTLNTTAVTCDSSQRHHRPSRPMECARRCMSCYERQTLQRPPSCLVNGTCTCLARPGSASTTQASVSTTALPVTQQPAITSTSP